MSQKSQKLGNGNLSTLQRQSHILQLTLRYFCARAEGTLSMSSAVAVPSTLQIRSSCRHIRRTYKADISDFVFDLADFEILCLISPRQRHRAVESERGAGQSHREVDAHGSKS
eukprot:2711269-Rhodomonas_salina.1